VTGEWGVYMATRNGVDDWFGDPVVILPGMHTSPQLLDSCKALYAVDGDQVLREYDQP